MYGIFIFHFFGFYSINDDDAYGALARAKLYRTHHARQFKLCSSLTCFARSISNGRFSGLELILQNYVSLSNFFCYSVQEMPRFRSFFIAHPSLLLVTFYENSLILATFSLILTSILRYMQRLNVDAPLWMSSTSGAILKSRTGQIFLISLLDRNVSTKMELNADDNTNLVTPDERNYTWKYISVLIGWLAFFSIVFVYAIMLILLFPTSTSPSSFTLNT